MTPICGIYALCDTSLDPSRSHLDLARQLLEGGVQVLQLRMKGETDLGKVREVVRSIMALKAQHSFTFIVNDFLQIGIEEGADGIHLGQDDLALPQARQLTGDRILIGYSSHSVTEALEAERQGASYVALGAIYPTATKGEGHPVVGLATLREVVQKIRVPLVAIGGINRGNLSEVAATGVDAAAMISALTGAKDISETSRWFVEQWKKLKMAP